MTINQPPPGSYGPGGAPYQPPAQPAVCAFHPDRATSLFCSRCGRPACPECLTPAAVGFHCRACVAEGRATQRQARTVSGARVGQQPRITMVLIAINLVAFAVSAGQARDVMDVTGSGLFRYGAEVPALVGQGQWWRIVSGGFLHLSLLHIALNMISLYMLGLALERVLGPTRYLVVYLLSLLGGSASVMLFDVPGGASAGASGAIFGLLGGLLVAFRRLRYDLRQLVVLLAINLFITFRVPGISWQAHLGGLVIGAAVTAAMVYPPQRLRKLVQLGGSIAILVVLAVVVVVRAGAVDEYQCQVRSDGVYCLPSAFH